jgi:purine-binding chemotaxis protein CheW
VIEAARHSRQLLEARARALAVPEPREEAATTALVLLRAAGQLVAFRAAEVEGAGRVREFATVPGGPAWLSGVVQLRGKVLSLLDLNRVWSEQRRGVADLTSYVILTRGGLRVGVLAEELLGFQDLSSALTSYQGTDRPGVVEVGRLGDDPVLVLSAARLFEVLSFGGQS